MLISLGVIELYVLGLLSYIEEGFSIEWSGNMWYNLEYISAWLGIRVYYGTDIGVLRVIHYKVYRLQELLVILGVIGNIYYRN